MYYTFTILPQNQNSSNLAIEFWSADRAAKNYSGKNRDLRRPAPAVFVAGDL
jgi:hypothetical protein